jgi:signal transduction histidine kinase
VSLRIRLFIVLVIVLAGAATVIWYGIRPSYADAVVEERLKLISEYQQQRVREADMLLYFWLNASNELQNEFTKENDNISLSFSNYTRILPDLAGFKITKANDLSPLSEMGRPGSRVPDFTELIRNTYIISRNSELWAGFTNDYSQFFISSEFNSPDGDQLRITTLFNASRIVDVMTQNVLRDDTFITVWLPNGSTIGRTLPGSLSPERTHFTSYSRANITGIDYLSVSTAFNSVPLTHSKYVNVSQLESQVAQLFSQSLLMLIAAFLALAAGGNLLINRVQRPIQNFIEDVTPFAEYQFDRPLRDAELPELSGVTKIMENIRLKLDHYKKINVEKVIVQEQRNRLLMTYATEIVAQYDQNGRFTFINELFSSLLGEASIPESGLHVADILDNTKSIIRKDSHFEDIVRDGLTIRERTLELELNISDTKVYYFEMHLNDLFDQNNNHLGGLMLLNDVTRSRELEKVRTEMINIIVHELQNPVSSGLGLTSYLIEESTERSEQLEILKLIQGSLYKLSGMIERFLQIARLESANMKLDMKPVDMNRLIGPVVESFKNDSRSRGIKIIINEESVPLISGSVIHIEDLMRNLISNAIKYGDDNRTIDVALWSDGNFAHFSVTDHGYGIPDEYKDKIFNKFFRIKKYDIQKGTGLGLAYVKEIVQKHGGQIKVDSNEQLGSRFTVSLPIQTASLQQLHSAASSW